jgi:transposase
MPVTIGVDPHKASHTAVALDEHGQLLDRQRIPATLDGYQQLRQWAGRWPQRCWAVEGAHGLGRALAQRLVADGERVEDVPAKLAARVRVLSVGTAARATTATRSRWPSLPGAYRHCGRSESRARRRCCTC